LIKVLYPVFEHIADDQRNEERQREVAVRLLEGERDGRSEYHGDTRSDAESRLFEQAACCVACVR
jgi:hypothetical protein